MNYEISKNKIMIPKNDDFCIRQILECGQIFRFKEDNSKFVVYFGKHKAEITENKNETIILCDDENATKEFFDLDRDYGEIKKSLSKNKIMKNAVEFGKGIRILKGDPEEIIFSFIISANNNIKRIQKIIEKLCTLGDNMGDYRAFPSAKQIATASDEFFESLHAGYRTPYIKETAKFLANFDLNDVKNLDTVSLKKWLESLKGVGPKVASCILLFGFSRFDCFPVDTWIEKVYKTYFFAGEKTRPQIESHFLDIFGKSMSGIAQQYLFFFGRSNPNFVK